MYKVYNINVFTVVVVVVVVGLVVVVVVVVVVSTLTVVVVVVVVLTTAMMFGIVTLDPTLVTALGLEKRFPRILRKKVKYDFIDKTKKPLPFKACAQGADGGHKAL